MVLKAFFDLGRTWRSGMTAGAMEGSSLASYCRMVSAFCLFLSLFFCRASVRSLFTLDSAFWSCASKEATCSQTHFSWLRAKSSRRPGFLACNQLFFEQVSLALQW